MWASPMTEKLRFCETRRVFLLTLPRLSLSVKSVGLAFCVPNGGFMFQMGLSTILKREGWNRGDTLPFSDTLVAPLPKNNKDLGSVYLLEITVHSFFSYMYVQ